MVSAIKALANTEKQKLFIGYLCCIIFSPLSSDSHCWYW